MGGQSDQEKAAQNQYNQVSGFNPNVKNRFDNFNLPYDPKSLVGSFNHATSAGVNTIKRNTKSKVNAAGKSAAAGLQSRGYGGSVLEDAISKARAKESEGGTKSITSLLTSRLGQLPGVLSSANQQSTIVPRLGQQTDFQNIANMFNKFGLQGNAIQGLSDNTWLDDALAVGNTAGQFLPFL